MLLHLAIRDMALVDRLELDFEPGLTVLTGETGAGKSILLDCLGFVLGWRGRADVVRAGAERGEVEAVFWLAPDHPVRAALAELGLPESDELILRREARADGRRQAWVNDRRVTTEALRSLSESLAELHGQHDDRGLLNPRGHRAILDAFAGNEPLLAETRDAWAALLEAHRAEASARDELAALAREADDLRHAVVELERISPKPGEAETLDAQRRLLVAARKLSEELARALAALSEAGAQGPLLAALRSLERAAPQLEGRIDPVVEAVGQAVDLLAEAERSLAHTLEEITGDPKELERVEERLFALRGLARKYGVEVDALAQLAEDLRARLATLDQGSEHLAALAERAQEAAAAHRALCAELSARRRAAAMRLDAAVAAELMPLKLERASFRTRIEPAESGPEGFDEVFFEVSTGPGLPPGPLNRIASGGELSRFLLALKVCLRRGRQVLIFDEIDRGVGGATADAVGRRLLRLAETGQVLVVTHSPQVAALGAHHLRVEKHIVRGAQGEASVTRVVPLGPMERIDEIARMLSGDAITDAARAAARALVEG